MKRTLLTGNGAAAWGARLAKIDYVPAFPITPQTEIIETLANWIETGILDSRLVTLESEHSMITAAGAAAATGVRVFTATSSQGLLYGMEMIYTVAGWRAPFVLVNVSRGLSAPITLEPDHNDVLAARDSGFLQIHCATCQEVLDSILIAYRLAEDERIRLPLIVNLDGFYLSFTREPVTIPDPEAVERFLPPLTPKTSPSGQAPPSAKGWRCWAEAHIPISVMKCIWRPSRRCRCMRQSPGSLPRPLVDITRQWNPTAQRMRSWSS